MLPVKRRTSHTMFFFYSLTGLSCAAFGQDNNCFVDAEGRQWLLIQQPAAMASASANSCSSVHAQSCLVNDIVRQANLQQLCNHQNWRLPSRKQAVAALQTLPRWRGVLADWVWTSSPHSANAQQQWRVNMVTGAVNAADRQSRQQVLLISIEEGTPLGVKTAHCNNRNPRLPVTAPELQQEGDGSTLLDPVHGLRWLRCSLGQRWDANQKTCTGSALGYSYDEAYMQAIQLPGHWRLPSRAELELLVEERCWSPMIRLSDFPQTAPGWYWTADSDNINPGHAWYIHFDLGGVYTTSKEDKGLIRLVSTAHDLCVEPPD